jgi:hypothetical protein
MKNTVTGTVKEFRSLGSVEATSEREGWIIEVVVDRLLGHNKVPLDFVLFDDQSTIIDILFNLTRSNTRAEITYNTKVTKHEFLPKGLPITGELISIEFSHNNQE